MHAVFATLTIDPAQAGAARSMLNEQVVPMLKATPGFVGGYWCEPIDGKAISMVAYDTEENARAAAPPVGPAPAPGVVIESVEIREVAAHA